MNYDYRKLKGKIKEKFGTQEAFAKAIGMGLSTINLKLNNNAEWSQEEMKATMIALNEPITNIPAYFFIHLV